MAGYEDGENNFSDDDLDFLPDNALEELESNAIIQFTQAATQAQRKAPPPSSDYGDEFDDEDLDDAVVIDEERSAPAVIPALNRNTPGQATQREQFQQRRYGSTVSNLSPHLPNRQRPEPPPVLNQPNRDRLLGSVSIPQVGSLLAQQGSQTGAADKVDDLQKQIQEVWLHFAYPSDDEAHVITVAKRTRCPQARP